MKRIGAWTVVPSGLVAGVLVILIAGCGTGSSDPQAACDRAFAQAMAIDPHSDTVRAVDGTIAGCPSLESWVAAAKRYPDALGGQDPITVARGRCASSGALAGGAVCAGLGSP